MNFFSIVKSLIITLSMYTSIPMPAIRWEEKNLKYCMCFLPAAGLIAGAAQWLLLLLCRMFSVSDFLYAALFCALTVLITGGIHIDGLIDTSDALGSHGTKEKKLQILADPHAGAFGIECEYIPEYIENEARLKGLVRPDFRKPYRNNTAETQRVILIGCVDNNKSRALCHKVFYETENLIYIDSGNGESTGQVVCGVRQKGRTAYKPVGTLYPDILKTGDKFPTELSCAERAASAPQSVTANLTAAAAVTSFLYNLLVAGELNTRYVTFSSSLIAVRAETVKKRKGGRKKCAA